MTSIQRQIALAFCESFENLDAEANVALRSPDCRHEFGPSSMNMGEPRTNDQFIAHVSSLKETLTGIPVTPKEIFECGSHVTIWATSTATFRDEVKDADPDVDWSYHGEYMFVLVFNQAGDKIERIIEFLDSKKVAEVRALQARAKRNLAAKEQSS